MAKAKHTTLRRAVKYALLMGALPAGLHVATAVAQDESQPEELIVTGSRIVSPNLESISPVTSISSEDITQTGKVRVEDIINQLPQAFAGQGSSIANGADGTATVDLRGLGPSRTLVLVNGRRLMPGDPDGGSAADLNFIPAALVKRVEVLTGGASSVYGADAVAGVVNFIMDTDFEGVRLEFNGSYYDHENDNDVASIVTQSGIGLPDDNVELGYSRDVTFAVGLGGEDDRGHAVMYATYRNVDPILQADYDYSVCTFNSGTTFSCGGSATTAPASFTQDFGTFFTIDENNNVRPFDFGADVYNFGPLNFYQRPDERYTAGVFADFDVNDHANVYGEFMFMDDRSVAQIAPSGAFLGTGVTILEEDPVTGGVFETVPGYPLNCNNPFLGDPGNPNSLYNALGCTSPDETVFSYIGRRNVEGGGRQDDVGHTAFRAVAGIRGDLTDTWSYDASFSHGTVRRQSTYLNDFSVTRLVRALNIVDPTGGDPSDAVCSVNADADPNNDDTNCVPYNIFQQGGVTQEALDYLQIPGFQRAEAVQRIVNANVTGDLSEWVSLPSASTGLQINVGTEYRHEETEFNADAAFQGNGLASDLAGQGAATLPVNGQFHVKELFLEARLPLIEGKALADVLSFETGYRFSDYSTGVDTDTYKFGIDWAPVDAIRFRGTFQHAVRVPNVGELFSSQQIALNGSTDPCAGLLGDADPSNDPEATLEQCLRTGMTEEQYGNVGANPASQYNGFVGGNPNLDPEEGDTVSFGAVFQPDFIPNLALSLDWFEIKVEDQISNGGLQDAFLSECIATGDPAVCDLIHRDALGSLWATPNGFIVDTSLNIGEVKTSGVDVAASYAFDIGQHRLGLNMVGTILESLETDLLGNGDFFDCAGFYGTTCGIPNPEWRHSLRATWSTPWRGIDVSLAWRYFDEVKVDKSSSDTQLAGAFAPSDARLGSRSYIDLSGSMTFAEKYTLRLGANNLFDKDPPLNGGSNCPAGPCNGNTWPQVYDALGRQLFATFTMDF
jgi:outer membrane receptor protein involved in Fe transport